MLFLFLSLPFKRILCIIHSHHKSLKFFISFILLNAFSLCLPNPKNPTTPTTPTGPNLYIIQIKISYIIDIHGYLFRFYWILMEELSLWDFCETMTANWENLSWPLRSYSRQNEELEKVLFFFFFFYFFHKYFHDFVAIIKFLNTCSESKGSCCPDCECSWESKCLAISLKEIIPISRIHPSKIIVIRY